MTRFALAACCVLLLSSACAQSERPSAANALQDPAVPTMQVAVDSHRGLEVAQRWCASCHQVEATGAHRTAAPSFTAIAADPRKNRRWLENFMTEEHLPMPTFRLYPDEQAHVIAYIEEL